MMNGAKSSLMFLFYPISTFLNFTCPNRSESVYFQKKTLQLKLKSSEMFTFSQSARISLTPS